MSTEEEKAAVSKQEISLTRLKTLIDGYVRLIIAKEVGMNINDEKTEIIPKEINALLTIYYPKQLYMIILNQKQLKLTLCECNPFEKDAESTKIDSKQCVKINDQQPIDTGGEIDVGSCHKQQIEVAKLSKKITSNIINDINDNKYSAIFKCGGKYNNKCGMMLYYCSDTFDTFDTYYYELPSIPFKKSEKNNPIYSDKYGLILFGYEKNDNGKVALLNININNDEDIKWDVQTLPKELTFNYAFPPNYCLINDSQIFIVNGQRYDLMGVDFDEQRPYNKQTSIYNLENNEFLILNDNPYPACYSGIVYNKCRHEIFIGGSIGSQHFMRKVYSYNLNQNKYIDNLPNTQNSYILPRLWCDNNATMLHIACTDKLKEKINYESIDLRAPFKWMNHESVNILAQNTWQEMEIAYYLSILAWQ